jgi:hypothetical protein
MVQKIITYVIISVAVGLAVFKSYKMLKRKKLLKLTDMKNDSYKTQTACPDCVAECILRDAPLKFKNENARLCEREMDKIKCS